MLPSSDPERAYLWQHKNVFFWANKESVIYEALVVLCLGTLNEIKLTIL